MATKFRFKYGTKVTSSLTYVVLTSGTSYSLPSGATSFKAWVIGAGGGGSGCGASDSTSGGGAGAGGVAYKTFTVSASTVSYSIGTAGVAGIGANSGSAGGATTLTYSSTTINGNGGSGGNYNNGVASSGGTYSGGDGGANGGTGAGVSGDTGGGGGGAIGTVNGSSAGGAAGNAGAVAGDVSGLQAAITGAGGYSLTSGGTAGGSGSSNPNNMSGGAATGFGCGGGSAGWYGGNGGAGLYGGGGGGAAGYTASQTGGTGGAGAVVLQISIDSSNDIMVDFEDYYVRADYFRSGNLWAWGKNAYGNLGDNTAVSKSSPVQTITRGSNWKQFSLGSNGYGNAVIKTDGTLWTWGRGTSGQLGDNTSTNKSSPVQTVAFGTNWSQVACGAAHTAAIKTDGTLWCWGYNFFGSLGDNSGTNRSSPVQTVALGSNWKQVSCGNAHTAAIKTDGTLWLWGIGDYGNLGDNTATRRSSPIQTITFGTNWQQVSCGNTHTAAIKTDGTLWVWGGNSYGKLGDNTITQRSSPVQTISFGSNWKQVSASDRNTAAVKTDGTLWVWGGNTWGQLGDNTATARSSPVQTIAYGNNWKQVSLSDVQFIAATKTDGTLWCWGKNANGQLGDNTTTTRSSPVQTVMFGTSWKNVGCGNEFTVAIQHQDDYQ